MIPSSAIFDEFRVLVTVADDEVADLVLQRETREEFRLAADLKAEVERPARVQNFLHDLAELVHLDRKYAAVFALIIEFRDGSLEGLVDRLDAVPQNILEADEQRKFQPAAFRLLEDVREIHRRAGFLQRRGDDVPGVVDVKILRAPAVDVVKARGRIRCSTARPYSNYSSKNHS